jgi:hypothetical protein
MRTSASLPFVYYVGAAESGQRREEGPRSGWIKVELASYYDPDNLSIGGSYDAVKPTLTDHPLSCSLQHSLILDLEESADPEEGEVPRTIAMLHLQRGLISTDDRHRLRPPNRSQTTHSNQFSGPVPISPPASSVLNSSRWIPNNAMPQSVWPLPTAQS